jgi:hypothetical protein
MLSLSIALTAEKKIFCSYFFACPCLFQKLFFSLLTQMLDKVNVWLIFVANFVKMVSWFRRISTSFMGWMSFAAPTGSGGRLVSWFRRRRASVHRDVEKSGLGWAAEWFSGFDAGACLSFGMLRSTGRAG